MKSRDLWIIGLGGNTPSEAGDPAATLEAALGMFGERGLRIVARSQWWRSAAYPPGSGPDFANGVAAVEADGPLEALLAILHAIEAAWGRERRERYAPRPIDLDLICRGALTAPDAETARTWISLPKDQWTKRTPEQAILPHPRLQDRAFVLGPMREIAPDWRHPILGRTTEEMWRALPAEERAGARPMAAPGGGDASAAD
ncbi:MAG: 2-amino-4-hydroxy-6-hydroxymethyldihydropteridine diphosphokinase [Pseudomonadota bacterium]